MNNVYINTQRAIIIQLQAYFISKPVYNLKLLYKTNLWFSPVILERNIIAILLKKAKVLATSCDHSFQIIMN